MKQLTEQDIDAIVANVKKELMAKIEKPKFEVGKVYKLIGTKAIYILVKVKTGINKYMSYGFDTQGEWSNLLGRDFETYGLTEATHQEWEAALIKEAEKRGYNERNTKCLHKWSEDKSQSFFDIKMTYVYESGKDRLWIEGSCYLSVCIFDNGKWDEVIKEKPLDEAKLITEAKELIKDAIGSAEAKSAPQIVTVDGKDYQLTVNLKLV